MSSEFPETPPSSSTPLGSPGPANSSRRSFVTRSLGIALTVVAAGAGASSAAKKKPAKKPKVKAATTAAATTAVAATAPAVTGVGTGTMDIAFTYTADGGGRVENPYVAVWLEDLNGLPVRTVHVNILQGQKGRRWLRDLERWATADQTRQLTGGADILTTVSSATRAPGAYKFQFDGLDDSKAPLPGGNYVLCIEAARQRGPYSLVKETLTLGGEPFTKAVTANVELNAINVTYVPKK
jgi:hypothetical protein